MYSLDGLEKLVIVLPSAFLVELLNLICLGKGDRVDEAMVDWLELALLRHLGK